MAEGRNNSGNRHWDDVEGVTKQRSKRAHDYRYFPEPDLPLDSSEGMLRKLETRCLNFHGEDGAFMSSYELNETDAMILSEHMALAIL